MPDAPSLIHRGHVKDGELYLRDDAGYYATLRSLNDQEVEVIVRRRRERRTLSQNAYFHGFVIPPLAEHCGCTFAEMKAKLKESFRDRRTRDMSKSEMADLIDHACREAAAMGVRIPAPGEAE